MEKLELKHIVGYLPYGLNFIVWHGEKEERNVRMVAIDSEENFFYKDNDPTFYISGIDETNNMRGNYGILESKPILRPLSDLTKEIEVNAEKFVPFEKMGYNKTWYGFSEYKRLITEQPYNDIVKLYEWHFDIHGLIEKGLAIDINTLAK